jgi:hypothetical protein
MFVCGALGNGKETSTGTWDASPLADVIAIACADIEVVERCTGGPGAGHPRVTALGAISDLTTINYSPTKLHNVTIKCCINLEITFTGICANTESGDK